MNDLYRVIWTDIQRLPVGHNDRGTFINLHHGILNLRRGQADARYLRCDVEHLHERIHRELVVVDPCLQGKGFARFNPERRYAAFIQGIVRCRLSLFRVRRIGGPGPVIIEVEKVIGIVDLIVDL
ncbi:hypothetical protein ES708_29566 [subsurface metagenome]